VRQPTPDDGKIGTSDEQMGDHIGVRYWWSEDVGPLLARSVNKLQHLTASLLLLVPCGSHVRVVGRSRFDGDPGVQTLPKLR